jgi:hypothetical protein
MIGIDMNERIEELARQCMSMRFFVDTASEEFDYKKFAELIVRECANIVQDSPWQLPQGYKSVDQAKLVKKYFGVEE